MGERLKDGWAESLVGVSRKSGKTGDTRREVLQEVGGDENLARLLLEIRGILPEGTPLSEKPTLGGKSLRVDAQKAAYKRNG